MDERTFPKPHLLDRWAPADQGAQPDSTLVFFGDPARVREGFAMALHAMGIGASMADVVAHDPSGKGE